MSQAELIYQEWIESLPIEQQMELVARITQRLAELLQADASPESSSHSIMELHGLGAKQWLGVDAQAYVDTLRNEWN